MKKCRSIKRAMRRGHYIDPVDGTYRSIKSSIAFRKKMEAVMKKAIESTQTDTQNE